MDEIELLDIADDLLVINKNTIERLFNDTTHNSLVLYVFYYKTAKWQKHNPIKANDEYCKKCLHWGADKLKTAKKKLKDMELIDIVRRTNEKGIVEGWYVKVNYYNSTTPKTTTPITPQLVQQETNTINNNILNTNNNINTKKKYGTYKRIKLTDKEYEKLVKDYGRDFIKNQIELLDEYVEKNNNKYGYVNFNLVLRKSIRENWFKKNKKEDIVPEWMNKDLNKEDELSDEDREFIRQVKGSNY